MHPLSAWLRSRLFDVVSVDLALVRACMCVAACLATATGCGDDDDDAIDAARADAGTQPLLDGAVAMDASPLRDAEAFDSASFDAGAQQDAAPREADGGAEPSDAATTLDASVPRDAAAALACDPDNGGLTLPAGFCAAVFASDVGRARHITVSPSGDVWVAIGNARDGSSLGHVHALRDTDGDGRADRMERFADDGGNGIVWKDGRLYFAQDSRIVRWDLPDGQLIPTGPAIVLVDELPATGDHTAKSIVLDGTNLYVNIGSATNSCQIVNRTLESPGIDPCPELDARAGIWRFSTEVPRQHLADGTRFVTGARNTNALALRTTDGALFGVVNGRDQLHENWPTAFSAEEDVLLPAEILVRFASGQDYGWPYCYFDPSMSEQVLAPEYGGTGTERGRCADVTRPLGAFPAHWAPLGMLFYTGSQFPLRYREGVFVTFHGSRFQPDATGPLPGYDVVFQPFAGDMPAGSFERFAEGFAGDARPLPEAAAHRPVGLAVLPDGAMLVGDDQGGRIWRIMYTGG